MNNNLIQSGLDWSINAINQSNNDIKSPNWLFRLLVVCIFFIFFFIF